MVTGDKNTLGKATPVVDVCVCVCVVRYIFLHKSVCRLCAVGTVMKNKNNRRKREKKKKRCVWFTCQFFHSPFHVIGHPSDNLSEILFLLLFSQFRWKPDKERWDFCLCSMNAMTCKWNLMDLRKFGNDRFEKSMLYPETLHGPKWSGNVWHLSISEETKGVSHAWGSQTPIYGIHLHKQVGEFSYTVWRWSSALSIRHLKKVSGSNPRCGDHLGGNSLSPRSWPHLTYWDPNWFCTSPSFWAMVASASISYTVATGGYGACPLHWTHSSDMP